MACNHKFLNYLNLERLDFEPTTLIVGTFNPLVEGNSAQWFYGRIDNNFWEVLPRLYGESTLRCSTPREWKLFCKRHKIAITDLIESIIDVDLDNPVHIKKLKTYSDKSISKDFKKHSFVQINEILRKHNSINNVYLTRGTGETFWKKLWRPIEKFAKENEKRQLNLANLITPSGYAFYQQGSYNKQNPLNTLSLEDFILKDWKSKWHKIN
jgi:G:T/U-mismatch repair DNA glycosylase